MDGTSSLIRSVSGAVGGSATGALMKKFSLGTVGNSFVGFLGGGVGGAIKGAIGGSKSG